MTRNTIVTCLALLCLLVSSVSAAPFATNSRKGLALCKTPKDRTNQDRNPPKPKDNHVIRGGASPIAGLTNSQKFVAFSSLFVTSAGLSVIVLPWEQVTELFGFLSGGQEPSTTIKMCWATSLIGWGIGKFVAVQAGPETTKKFCQINILASAFQVWICIQSQSVPDIVLNGLLFLGYLYFGYIA